MYGVELFLVRGVTRTTNSWQHVCGMKVEHNISFRRNKTGCMDPKWPGAF